MANYPTPSNIVSITYQLKQQVGDPSSIRGQLPSLVIQFIDDNSVTRNKVVTFREMLPYLQYLKAKAVSLGQQIVCTPEATYDNKIVLVCGQPASGFLQVVQVSAFVGGVCTEIPIVVYLDHAAPFVVGDILFTDPDATLPLLGFVQVANVTTGTIYDLNPATGEVLPATGSVCPVPPSPTIPATVTFNLNGTAFAADQALAADVNVTSITGTSIANAKNTPFTVSFQVPRLGGENFSEDYNAPANAYVAASPGAGISAAYWICSATYVGAGGVDVVDVDTNTDFITVRNINNPSGQSLETAIWTDAFDKLYSLGYVGALNEKIRLPRSGAALNPQTNAQSGITGIFNIRQYNAAGTEIGFKANAYSTSNIPFVANAALITLEYKRLKFINNIVGSSNKIIVSDSSVSGYAFGLIYDESNTEQYLRYPKGLAAIAPGGIGVATLDAALLPYNVKFYANGVLLDTINVTTQLQNVVPSAGNDFWDTLVFGTGTPPATGSLTVENQMGVVPQETTQIDSVDIDAAIPVIVVPAYPVLPLQNSSGTFTGNAASAVTVTISNTTIIPPSTVRVIDALGANHDQAYVADGAYNFVGINTLGLVRVILF